jgi:hypothetical protein
MQSQLAPRTNRQLKAGPLGSEASLQLCTAQLEEPSRHMPSKLAAPVFDLTLAALALCLCNPGCAWSMLHHGTAQVPGQRDDWGVPSAYLQRRALQWSWL